MQKDTTGRSVPSAVEALEDDAAREKRAQHAEKQKEDVMREVRAETPSEVDNLIPYDQQPGRLQVKGPGVRRSGEPDAPEVIEDHPEALAKIQDPYNERTSQSIKMVNATDSYGNVVKMPV